MSNSSETISAASPPAVQSLEQAESILKEIAGAMLSSSSDSQRAFGALYNAPANREKLPPMTEARYRTLVELLPAVTFMAGFEEGLSDVYVSPQIESLLGYTQKEWLDNPVLWYQRLHVDDRDRWNREFAETVALSRPLRSAYRFIARNGRIVWIHAEAKVVQDENGFPLFIHGVGVDITQTKEAEQRVIEYAHKLEQTNKELEQFAYVASHDLQEPLRSIVSYTQMIAEDYQGKLDGGADKQFARIVEAATRLKALIQALLEFSRVGRGHLSLEPTDMALVLHEATVNLHASIKETRAEITRDLLPEIVGHHASLVALFQNLLSNAIKYRSKEPPRIHVSATRTKERWQFSVQDNGIGIDPQYHAKIFVIFQRLHTQKQVPGTGIGLSICKKIVDFHGGDIWVESQLGHGSTFKFTLPDTRLEI